MKELLSLNPKWIQPANWCGGTFYIGVSFLCPHCEFEHCPTCGHAKGQRLVCMFYPPIDPEGMAGRVFPWENWEGKSHQRVSGETFGDLTINPSIGYDAIGHWHGNITAGVCTP